MNTTDGGIAFVHDMIIYYKIWCAVPYWDSLNGHGALHNRRTLCLWTLIIADTPRIVTTFLSRCQLEKNPIESQHQSFCFRIQSWCAQPPSLKGFIFLARNCNSVKFNSSPSLIRNWVLVCAWEEKEKTKERTSLHALFQSRVMDSLQTG